MVSGRWPKFIIEFLSMNNYVKKTLGQLLMLAAALIARCPFSIFDYARADIKFAN